MANNEILKNDVSGLPQSIGPFKIAEIAEIDGVNGRRTQRVNYRNSNFDYYIELWYPSGFHEDINNVYVVYGDISIASAFDISLKDTENIKNIIFRDATAYILQET